MKHVLIRDDDLCFFSEPARVDEAYGFIFDRALPLNFSVIPNVNASARTNSADFGPGTYEPFIPEQHYGRDECFSVLENPALTAYLREKAGVEILQHGYCHGGTPGTCEFEDPDGARVAEKIRAGAEILKEAFGRVPTTFVAPQDKYSRAAFIEIESSFDLFSLGWVDRSRLPASLLPAYFWMKLRRSNTMGTSRLTCLEHPGVIFSQFKDTNAEVLRFRQYMENHSVTVLVLHHWEFYTGGQLNRPLHSKFKDLVNSLADSGQCRFLNFRELSKSPD